MVSFHPEIQKLADRMGVALENNHIREVNGEEFSLLGTSYKAIFKRTPSSLTLCETAVFTPPFKLVIVPSREQGKQFLFRQYKGDKLAIPAPLPLKYRRGYSANEALFALGGMRKSGAIRYKIVKILLFLLETQKT